jgi:Immunoglobulin I-set domain
VQPKAAQELQPSTSDEVIATRSPLLLSATKRPTEPEMTSQPPTTATVPPAFDRKPKSESVTEGDVVKWTCLVRGTPEVLVSWEKDGQEVDTNGDRFKVC